MTRSLYNSTHWTDRFGNSLLIADMELSHVGNLMRYLEYNATRLVRSMPFPAANGDMAQLGLESEWEAAQENPEEFIRNTPLYRALAARFAPKDTMTTTSPITEFVVAVDMPPAANLDRDDLTVLQAALTTFGRLTLGALSIAILSYRRANGECLEYSGDDDAPALGMDRPALWINDRITLNIVNGNLNDAAEQLSQLAADPLLVLRMLCDYHEWDWRHAADMITRLQDRPLQ